MIWLFRRSGGIKEQAGAVVTTLRPEGMILSGPGGEFGPDAVGVVMSDIVDM